MGGKSKSRTSLNSGKSKEFFSEEKPLLSPMDSTHLPLPSETDDVYSLEAESKATPLMPSPRAVTTPVIETSSEKTHVSFHPLTTEKPPARAISPFFPFPTKKEPRTRNPKVNPLTPGATGRKTNRRSNAGKVAAMCVGETIDIDAAEKYYKSAGYFTSIRDDVLHVTNVKGYRSGGTSTVTPNRRQQLTSLLNYTFFTGYRSPDRFDLFIFQCGSIVWWGLDMECYRSVSERLFFYGQKGSQGQSVLFRHIGFLARLKEAFVNVIREQPVSPAAPPGVDFVQHRYAQNVIEELFPLWLNFSVGTAADTLDGAVTGELDDNRFLEGLQKDHILLQSELPAHKEAISHALAQSVKLDILEPLVDDLLLLSRPLPKELSTKGHAKITANCVNKSKGELFLCRMNLRDLLDEPEYFWDFPWFYRYYGILRADYSVEQRVVCLEEKLSAVQEILDMLGDQFTQEHNTRLEWIIIWLIIAAVVIAGIELYTQIMRLGGQKAA